MHAAIHLHAKWSQPNNTWKNADRLLQHKTHLPLSLHLKPKPLPSWQKRDALKISSGCPLEKREKEEGEEVDDDGKSEGEESLVHPSIRIHKGDRLLRYVLEGGRLREDGCNNYGFCCNDLNDFTRFVKRWFEISLCALRELFIPRQVGPSYMDYLRWKFTHRICSSTLQVLATQSMFRAIGIGYSRSLSSAAALNWVLKDGLGRLSRCIYTASVGSTFDTNLKRVRFSTSVLYSLSIGIEMLTPVFPQYFLILATTANVAKSISLAAYIATSSAIHRSFAMADNLGEISAKSQIQTVCFDNLGLLLAAALNLLWKTNQRLQASLPLMIYPIFAAMDLYAISQGLRHVHLQTVTKDRLEIIINRWIAYGLVPSPSEASSEEESIIWGDGSARFTIRIGCVDPEGPPPKFLEKTLQSLGTDDMYFICLETLRVGLARKHQCSVLLCLHEKACTSDILRGMLEACHLRESLLKHKTRGLFDSVSVQVSGVEQSAVDISYKDWCKMRKDSRKFAECEVDLLIEGMKRSGWALKNILLNSPERMRFSLEI